MHFDSDLIYLEKLEEEKPLSAVYFDGEKSRYFVKRFLWDGGDKEENIITAHSKSELNFLSNDALPRIQMVYRKSKGEAREPEEVDLVEFISVKGVKAKGNQLTSESLNKIEPLESLPEPTSEPITENTLEEKVQVTDSPLEVTTNLNEAEPEDTAESMQEALPEPKEDEKGSYGADDEAPQITLDF